MAGMTALDSGQQIPLFNSPLETGLRAVAVLNASYPRSFDLTQITWFDHLVVHTGDIEGPPSLHPALPHRSGELLVRRRLIEEGLSLMRRLHLVDVFTDANGISYKASDAAPAFLELMRSPYSRLLMERAEWLSTNVCSLDSVEIEALVRRKIGRWSIEFQHRGQAQSSHT